MRRVGNPSVRNGNDTVSKMLPLKGGEGEVEASCRSVNSPQNPATLKHVAQFKFGTQSSALGGDCW